MSKSKRTAPEDKTLTRVARATKKTVLLAKQARGERKTFKAHLRDLVAGTEYL